MTEEQFLERLSDLVHSYVHSGRADDVIYGESIETEWGRVDYEFDLMFERNAER